MIIVKLFGGLGNQMFQHAAARQVAYKFSTSLKLDLTYYQTDAFRSFDLGCFNIEQNIASSKEINYLTTIPSGLIPNILHRLYNRIKPKQSRPKLILEKVFHFDGDRYDC